MDEPFDITNTDEKMTLDASRSATTTFTVHSTESIRGRAELLIECKEGQPKRAAAKPASDRQEEPVEVKDPYDMPEGLEVDIIDFREHEFGAGDTKEYAVQLSVLGGKASGGAKVSGGAKGSSGAERTPAPQAEGEGLAVESNPLQVTVAGAQPGAYWLRLDMVNVENPDDMRAKGPPVEFVVPGRPFPWWIVAVAAVVLAIVATGVAMLLWSRVTVPDVRDQPVAKAEATLQAAGLTVTATMTITSETVMRDWVVSTAPEAEMRVRRGSWVTLIVSGGPSPVPVPDVLGLSEARAVEALMRVGFKMGPTSTVSNAEVTPGWVVATSPEPGATVEKGSEVTLVLSSGPEMVPVPNVEGQTEKRAQEMLAEARLEAGPSSRVHSADVLPGYVADTNPEPGKSVPVGSTVDLVLSGGPEAPKVDFYMRPRVAKGTLEVEYRDLSTGEGILGRMWDFGDGETSTEIEGFHVYTRDGPYTVTLTISNAVGPFQLTKTDYITVEVIPPVAGFDFSGRTLVLPDSRVTFTDTSGEEPTSWLWDFGDGVISTQQSPVHQFQWAGTFPVTLEATNSAGSSEATRFVTIGRPECLETAWSVNGGPTIACADGFVAWGARCRGAYCDQMSLICCRYHLGTDDQAQTKNSDWFSEEGGFLGWGSSAARFEQGSWLKGLQCRGRNCDNVMLEYVSTPCLRATGACHPGPSFSEEGTGSATCSPGEYVGGLKCSGAYCDNVQLWCCPAQ